MNSINFISFNWTMSSALLFMSMLLVACEPTVPAPDAMEKAVIEARTMLFDYQSAVRENGLLAEFEFLDSSSDFFWIPPGANTAMDYAAVRKAVIENAKDLDTVSNEWRQLVIHPLSHDIATFAGKLSSFTISRGDTSIATLLESGTVVRRAGGWRLLSGQTSVAVR